MINREMLPVAGLSALTLGSLVFSSMRPSEPALNSQLLGLATEMSRQRSSVVCISFNCGGVGPSSNTTPAQPPATTPAQPPAPSSLDPNFVYYRVPLSPNSQPIDQYGQPLPIYHDEEGKPYTLAAR